MPYRWLDELTRADLAFEATGDDLEEVFRSAWEATLAAMLEAPPRQGIERRISLGAPSWEDLLLELLEKIVFVKDAEGLLLAPADLTLRERPGGVELSAGARVIPVEAVLGLLRTDVKAVTMHCFSLIREATGWRATVVLDV